MRDNDNVCDARPDYESEYYRLLDENKKMRRETTEVKRCIDEIYREKEILQAKLEIVHLIFGNRVG